MTSTVRSGKVDSRGLLHCRWAHRRRRQTLLGIASITSSFTRKFDKGYEARTIQSTLSSGRSGGSHYASSPNESKVLLAFLAFFLVGLAGVSFPSAFFASSSITFRLALGALMLLFDEEKDRLALVFDCCLIVGGTESLDWAEDSAGSGRGGSPFSTCDDPLHKAYMV